MSETLSERLRAVGLVAEYTDMPTIAEAADTIDALVEALERWEAAYQTGRHEPLVIASEAARATLEKATQEPVND